MTTFEKLDAALSSRGWSYDAVAEQFKSSADAALDWENIYALVPGMTEDELAAYQDDQYDQLCKRLRPK